MFTLGEKATNLIKVDMLVNGRSLPMELDTGAAVSIIYTTRKAIFPATQLQHSPVNLKTYTGTYQGCWGAVGESAAWPAGGAVTTASGPRKWTPAHGKELATAYTSTGR